MTQTFTNLDCDARTVFYAAGDEGDAIPMIEIRANITEAGWDTIAFVESSCPQAEATARDIVRCLTTHAELLAAIQRLVDDLTDADEDRNPETGDEYDSVANARAAIAKGRG